MIIVRLHLLLVPPQKPDFELSNSDEIFIFFYFFSITPLSDFEMGSEQYGSLSGALKKKKTNANGC